MVKKSSSAKLSENNLMSVLNIITAKFKLAKIRYIIIGSTALYLQGMDLHPDDIDIVIKETDAGKTNRLLRESMVKPIPVGKIDYGWGNSNTGLFNIKGRNIEIGYPPNKLQKTKIYMPKATDAKIVNVKGVLVPVSPLLELLHTYRNWYKIGKREKDLKKIELIEKFLKDKSTFKAKPFDIEWAKQELIRGKSVSFIDKTQHANMVKWMSNHKPRYILGRPVWIVPHSYVGSRWAVRPFGLMFVSDRFPGWALKNVVYHELVEESAERDKSIKNPHLYATEQELYYIMAHKLLKKSIDWMSRTDKSMLRARLKEWKAEGLQTY